MRVFLFVFFVIIFSFALFSSGTALRKKGGGISSAAEERKDYLTLIKRDNDSSNATDDHDHDHDHEHDPVEEILAIIDENNDTVIDAEEFHEWFALIFPELIEAEEGGGHDHDHDHAHRRQSLGRSASSHVKIKSTRLMFAMGKHQMSTETNKRRTSVDKRDSHCPLDEDLFAEFDADGSEFLNGTEISLVAQEMIVLLLEGCNEAPESEHEECEDPDTWAYWLAGLASTLLVCMLSLAGIVLLPCMGRKHKGWQAIMMMSMIGFAAGALFGDAIFHILPEIFGAHSHDHEGHGGHDHGSEEEEDEDSKEYLGLASLVLVGVLLFFIIEKVVLFFIGEAHSHGDGFDSDGEEEEDENCSSCEEEMEERSKNEDGSTENTRRPSFVNRLHSSAKQGIESVQSSFANVKELGEGSIIKGSALEIKKQSINSVKRLQFAKSYGWLNLVADAFHNFIDGVAIGASYSQSLSLGISTTLAIIFHEIPQELGDFAMIVRAGFGRIFALLFNLFSAMLAFLGCIIGLGVGQGASKGEKWILAFTAGGFLYISLANMIPELHGYRKKRHWLGLVFSALQLCGFILGAGILLIIAAFEEEISFGC